MNFRSHRLPHPRASTLGAGTLVLTASLALAACGGSPSPSATPTPAKSSAATASPTTTASPASEVTIKTATVAGYGTVLVNSSGRTLYTLSSESGGNLTCTVANGCTKVWIEVDLPSGSTAATAGSGAKSSLLGTETGASGTVVTYNGWPIYTFSGDKAADQANGEGLSSFGGSWYVLGAGGAPVKSATAASSPSSSGYSY
ncbi:MAG: hypothetical protein WA751_08550 [Candidatus Dormiibacterota bacterium]